MDVPEITSPPEVEKTIEHAWLFDVDGVITHPEQKKVTEPQIFDEIIKRLQAGEPVALVTGRSLDWLVDRVVTPLEAQVEQVENKRILDNFFVSGEFSGAYITYQNSKRELYINQEISVPTEIVKKARQITEQEFSDSMFWDEDKKTMVSIEMHDGFSVTEFKEPQRQLGEKLRQFLKEYAIDDQFEVHEDRIATNIRDKRLNKHFAAKQVINWLKRKNIVPKLFVIFGDNVTDCEMSDELHANGLNVELVFVGDPNQIKDTELPYRVIFTKERLEKGTLEYLKGFNHRN